ncbi:hypothetical protein E4U43_007886 [Claviceps pusilla]|uniref:Uncharacterized protein n=1 Tax=Claviceps pusilla TaxID=123648 RepID=A0A9P7NE10_9HYPO|nr:hypothetical protein E4U43_007886 [Claviceps pusilla]
MFLSSPPREIVHAQLRRRFATVPKDQLQILDHDGAWAVDPKDRHGVPLVPDHILQDMISHHPFMQSQAARQAADRISSATKDIVSKDHKDVEARGGHGDDDDDDVNRASSQEREDEDEDEGSLVSGWSVSPVRKPFHSIPGPEVPEFQTQILQRAIPQVDRPDAALSVSQDTVPTPEPCETPHHVETMDEGDEDEEDEEEMEVDLPAARESSQARVNLESTRMQMMACTPATTVFTQITSNETPSCAQPDQRDIISGNVLEARSPTRREKETQQRHHRRMRPIQFEGTTPIRRADSSSVVRLPSTSRLADVDSSMSTSSSSIIPATCTTAPTQKSAASGAAAVPILTNEHSSPPRTLPQPQDHDVASTQRPFIESPLPQEPQVTSLPKDIYSLFTSTYPAYIASYAGSLKNFVKALLCLEYLQSERGLHEFLYDDFIRAFSSAYLQYVRNAGPGQEALPAIEWFNLRDGPPEFSLMIITKRNLRAALQEFPEEVSLARRFIGERPQKEKAPPRERESKRQNKGAGTNLDRNSRQTRQNSAPGTTEDYACTASVPCSQLGSDAHAMSSIPPTSSARLAKTPSASHYFERMKSESRNRSAARTGSVDHQARLREHFRKTAAKRILSAGSRHGSVQ